MSLYTSEGQDTYGALLSRSGFIQSEAGLVCFWENRGNGKIWNVLSQQNVSQHSTCFTVIGR
jgi:hypothetical protein